MYRQKREERVRKKLEEKNQILKKKATVGWMLGSLFEVYLKGETDGGIDQIIKMLRNLQKELEDSIPSHNESSSSHVESIEREARDLLAKEVQKCDISDEALHNLEPSRKSLKFPCTGSPSSECHKKQLRSETPQTRRGSPSSNPRLSSQIYSSVGSQRKSTPSRLSAKFQVNCYHGKKTSCEICCCGSEEGDCLASKPVVEVEVLEAKNHDRDHGKSRSPSPETQRGAGCKDNKHILASMDAHVKYSVSSADNRKSRENQGNYFSHSKPKLQSNSLPSCKIKHHSHKRNCTSCS